MQIVTTHTNMDFDGLASVVAAICLHPKATGVLPSHMMPNVKAFLGIHRDLFKVIPRSQLDIDAVDSLIVVDANSWNRLDRMTALAEKQGLEIKAWDHHMAGAAIQGPGVVREEVGAAVTLLLEEMARRDTPFTPMHATLFLLGIYDDTGSLSFSSATPRDARMVAFLLENGADLNMVSAYLSDTMDDSHSRVFSEMLTASDIMDHEGLKIGISALPVKSGLTMLATLVARYKEFKGLDAAFGIFLTGLDKCMVIGRGNPKGIDVGAVVRGLGGGGHPGAGSAVVKGTDLETVTGQVLDHIAEASRKEVMVRDIMSDPDRFTAGTGMTVARAAETMAQRQLGALILCEEDRFLGLVSEAAVQKAKKSNRLDTPVKAFLRPDVPRVEIGDNARTALSLMNKSEEGILPVVDRDRLAGVLTRGNLILHIYDM